MKVIQSYESDFSRVLEESEGILELLNDSRKIAQDMIEKINLQKKEIHEIAGRKDELENISNEIIKVDSEIKSLNLAKVAEEKKIQKIRENEDSIKTSLKNELLSIGAEVE